MKAVSSLRLDARDAHVIALVLGIKALLFAFGVVAFETQANTRLEDLGAAVAIWDRWDSRHYLWLAEHGYSAEGDERWLIAFLPLFPWLTRAVALVTRHYLLAGLLVSTAASLAAGLLLRRLAALDADDGEALRAVALLFVFPTSFFLHVPYTEGLFLALGLGAFLAARRRSWMWAGALGGLGALARVTGVLLLPALALEAWSEWRQTRRARPAWFWLLLIGAGFGVYLALNHVLTGEPFAFLRAHREHWYRSSDWPWSGLGSLWRARAERAGAESQMLGTQELVFALLGLVSTLAGARAQRVSYTFWMAANWVIFVGQSFVYCVPRFSLTLFPMFLLLARLTRRPAWALALGAWSLLFLALFTSLYVQGRWAF